MSDEQTPKEYRIVELIEMLVANEGATLTICCPNPDFDGPQRVIDLIDDWTDWEMARFEGDALVDALEAALTSREAGRNRAMLKKIYTGLADRVPMSTCRDCGCQFESNKISPHRCEACQAVSSKRASNGL